MADRSKRYKYYGDYEVTEADGTKSTKTKEAIADDAKEDLDIDEINRCASKLYSDSSKIVNISRSYQGLITAYSGCLSITDSTGNTITAEKLIEETINSTDPLNRGGMPIINLSSGPGNSIINYVERIKTESMDKFNDLQDKYNNAAKEEVKKYVDEANIKSEEL